MKSSLTLIALAALSALGAAKPIILVSTNNMNSGDVAGAPRLQADGTWFISANSPSMNLDLWRKVCSSIGTSTFVTEDGGISPNYLMNAQLTPRITLRNLLGNYVDAPADGSPLAASIAPAQRSDGQIFRWCFVPATGMTPIIPTLLDLPKSGGELFLQSSSGNWALAQGGGGSTLTAGSKAAPTYWERLRFDKLPAAHDVLRSGDHVSIQTWNGFFNGGSYVSADLNEGARLVANRSSAGDWETFSPVYPCEFVTGRQVATVTHAMAYHEFSDVAPGAREYTLNVANIAEVAWRLAGGKNLAKPDVKTVVLARSFVDLSFAPGVLPTLKQQVLNAAGSSKCGGVVWEVGAGGDLGQGSILQGIDAVRSKGKDCFVMISPKPGSVDYTADLMQSIAQLKKSKWYDGLKIVLTCYRADNTDVEFLGGTNSVEGALKWLKAHR